MKKRISLVLVMVCMICMSLSGTAYAAYDIFGNEVVAPGSQTSQVDFMNVTKGMYYDGNDYYFLLEQGVPATNYLLNLHGDKYYFGDDGKMVKDNIVEYDDEKYYFDPNGTMIKNMWVTHEEVDDDGSVESVTYYFGPAGRAYRAVDRSNGIMIKNIDGEKFGFNENGARLEGYVTKDGEEINQLEEEALDQILYYFDPEENYATASGWILYDGERPEELDDGEEIYLYFDEKTGRKVYSNEPGKYVSRIIDGERYLFNYTGVRQKKWHQVATSNTPRYYSEDYEGFLAKGWFMAVPKADSIEEKNRKFHTDDEEQWYYAASDGKVVRNSIRKIGNFYYCFDRDGVMQSDCLVAVEGNQFIASYKLDDVTKKQVVLHKDEGGILTDGQKWMYFTEPENELQIGSMCRLNKTVDLELGDENVTFIANSRGGYGATRVDEPAERNGKYYQNGVLLRPDVDVKYGIVRAHNVPGIENYYVVGGSGNRIMKRGAFKDENGDFVLVGGSSGNFYLGTYNFEKCKLTSKNGATVWQIEDRSGEEIICSFGNEASLSEYLTKNEAAYLNFTEWSH